MHWFLVIGGLALMASVVLSHKKYTVDEYFKTQAKQSKLQASAKQAIQLNTLSNHDGFMHVYLKWVKVSHQLGDYAWGKLALYSGLVVTLAVAINHMMLSLPDWQVATASLLVGWVWGLWWLANRDRKQFEESFPDALNMLTSSLSAGESVGKGIGFVGEKLSGEVGKEFKRMSERLKLGEPLDDVFRKSCERFPYPAFQFFVITLRANMQRGGQLKEVMTRLNRQMFEARAMERKKFAMTSEARISAKIVGATPFVFLFLLQFLSPENFEFIMFSESGRPILYYMLVSETIGLAIIWALMKGVKS